MHRRWIAVALWMGVSWAAAPVLAQSEDGNDGDRGLWWARTQEQREQWRQRAEQMTNATPEEREQARLDGWVQMLTRTYELTDDQQKTVRNEVVKIRDEYRQSLGEDGKRLDAVREQMSKYWRERMADPQQRDSPMDDPLFQKLRLQMQEITSKHPFNFQEGAGRVEALLPPEQAQAGRERREQWQKAMGEMREGWSATRDPNLTEEERRQAMREQFERMRERFQQMRDSGAVPDGAFGPGGAMDLMRQRLEAREAEIQAQREAESRHPWDVYTREFVTKYGLDPSQIAAARSILGDVRARGETVSRNQAAEREKARALEDAAAREQRLKELEAPLDELFTELKTRLHALLTAEQRARDEVKPAPPAGE